MKIGRRYNGGGWGCVTAEWGEGKLFSVDVAVNENTYDIDTSSVATEEGRFPDDDGTKWAGLPDEVQKQIHAESRFLMEDFRAETSDAD